MHSGKIESISTGCLKFRSIMAYLIIIPGTSIEVHNRLNQVVENYLSINQRCIVLLLSMKNRSILSIILYCTNRANS